MPTPSCSVEEVRQADRPTLRTAHHNAVPPAVLDESHPPQRVRSTSYVYWAIGFLTFNAVVRSELLILLGPLALQAALHYSSFYDVIKVGLHLGCAVRRLVLLAELYFNVPQGKSSNGACYYLPKPLLASLPLSAFGILSDSRIRALLFPYLAFFLFISGLAHKEWQSVIYVVPAFNTAVRGTP
ncbi:hypothetical protein C8Q74DRAFT_1366434 [Fomes fomentarius]|nr:hypothetical protein C8Q74DRAFT_1366434 [Fomes fomentarius]